MGHLTLIKFFNIFATDKTNNYFSRTIYIITNY